MKTWLSENWYIIAVLIIMAVGTVIIAATPPTVVQAAPVAPVSVVMCVKTATTGPIDFYLCSPETGPEFITNSVGFMQVVD